MMKKTKSEYSSKISGGDMKNNVKKSCLKGAKPAFSIFEIAVVLVVMTGIILLVGKIFIGDRQREYDAKYNKIAASLSSNIAQDLMKNTGFDYADYIKTVRGNEFFRSAAIKDLNRVGDSICDNCWSTTTIIGTKDGLDKDYPDLGNPDNWDTYELNDGTVIAINKTKDDDGTYPADIVIDVNGPKGPNEVGKDIRVYEEPNNTCTHIPPKPEDKYLYTLNPNTCEWIKGECDPAKITGADAALDGVLNTRVNRTIDSSCNYNYVCRTGASNDLYQSGKTATQNPTLANGCQYVYSECPVGSDNSTYIAKYHGSGYGNVHITPPTEPNCKYGYDCNGTAVDSGKVPGYATLVANGVLGEEITDPTPDNNCTRTYNYPCKKITNDYDTNETTRAKHGYATVANARVSETVTQEPVPTNSCVRTHSYACITTVDVNKDDKIGGYSRVKTDFSDPVPENNCEKKYTYECKEYKNTKNIFIDNGTTNIAKDKEDKAIDDLVKKYKDYSRVTKVIPNDPKQTAAPSNNCENIYEYKFYCADANIQNTNVDKNATYAGYSNVKETPTVQQAAAVANNCEKITKYTYACKNTVNKYEDDNSKKANYDSSIIKETKTTANTPKQTAAVANNCENIYVNSYTYACIPEKVQNTETGKNATYAGYSNVKETAVVKQSATVDNNCKKITEYTYACIPEKIKNTETGKTNAYKNNSNVKEEKTLTQQASIANNCENKYTYAYSCKTTTDTNTGYNKKYSDNAAKQDSIITETKVITQEATLANNCENKYTYAYNCKKEDKSNTGYNSTYSAYAAKENSNVVEKITNTQKATLDNNCKSKNKYEYNCLKNEANNTYRKNINSDVAKTTQTPKLSNECLYKYQCKTDSNNKTYDKNKHNNANMIETAPTVNNDCRYSYICKMGADNSTYNASYQNDPNYTVEATPTMANNCTYAYAHECPVNSGEKYYIVWRGAGAAHRSLKNMLEEAGNTNLAAKISTDMSFYKEKSGFIIRDENTMKEICSSMDTDPWSVMLTPSNQTESKQEAYVSGINQKCGTNYTVESFSNKLHEGLAYPEEDVRAYILNSNGTVVDTIPASYDSSASINSDFGKYRGSSITGTHSNDNMSGTLFINGCPYDVEGKYRLASPLVLDLKGDGFKFTSVKDGIDFDLDADGNVDETAWTAKQNEFDDAFLVLDKDGDGQVNSGSELFGDQNGEDNGFLELSKYDDNGDGKIDKHDKIYHKLHLWADMNGDGKVDHPQEWKTLEEMGITEISTGYNKVLDQDGNARTDKYGNDTSLTGSFKRVVEDVVDGVKTFVEKVGTMIDVFFQMVSGLFGGK